MLLRHRYFFAGSLFLGLASTSCSGGGGMLVTTALPSPKPTPSPTNAGPSITEFIVGAANPAVALNASSITAGSDGGLWFVADTPTSSIGRIATTGASTLYPVAAFADLVAMGTGPDGTLWFTGSSSAVSPAGAHDALIGRITTTGSVTSYDITAADSRLTAPYCITTGPDGALWFTNFVGGLIGRITTGGAVTTYAVAAPSDFPQVNGVTAGPDGALWYTGFERLSANASLQTVPIVGRITTAGTITDYSAAARSAGVQIPDKIVVGPDGALWFTDWNSGHSAIGRINTGGAVSEFALSGEAYPTSITVGPDHALWFSESGSNAIGRITTGGSVTEYSAGISPNADPNDVALGADGAIWFTEQNTNKIGRLVP